MTTAKMTTTPTATYCQKATDAQHDQSVLNRADDKRADDRADDGAFAAEQTGAADDDGGDRVQRGGFSRRYTRRW